MIVNLGQVRARHKWLLNQARTEIHAALRGFGVDAVGFMQADPGFNAHGTGAGTALGSITKQIVRLSSGKKLILRNRAKHAAYLEHGTEPHTITARRKPYLHFFLAAAGHWIRTKSVQHPGTRAYQFMSRGIQKASGPFLGKLHARLSRLFRRF